MFYLFSLVRCFPLERYDFLASIAGTETGTITGCCCRRGLVLVTVQGKGIVAANVWNVWTFLVPWLARARHSQVLRASITSISFANWSWIPSRPLCPCRGGGSASPHHRSLGCSSLLASGDSASSLPVSGLLSAGSFLQASSTLCLARAHLITLQELFSKGLPRKDSTFLLLT